MRFQEAFKLLNGREATAEDVLKFERLTTALETTPGDAMLAVLVALDHYETLYGTIPAKIRKESESTLASFKLAAEKTATAAFKTSEAAHAEALVQLAEKVAVQTATKSMFKWAAGCITLVVAILIPAFLYAHSSGKDSGYQAGYGKGYTEAKDEKAAAAWANTPQGRMAYRLAQTGSIEKLIRCDQPGWADEKGVCYVKTAKDGNIYGWRLP